jgi:DNA repair exonuclease SbcCD nuclease subunit
VGLLHTQVHSSIGADQHDSYAPSELGFLARSGYDYWALGHVHIRQELSEDPPIWYPGSLQGRTHADQGERGALLVDLSDRHAPAISFRSLAPVRWETVEVSRLDDVHSLDELERRVQMAWRSVRDEEPGASGTDWMVRIRLRGACPLWPELQVEEDRDVLAGELQELLGALDVVVLTTGVHPVVPLDEHRARVDVLGEALRLAESVRKSEGRLRSVVSEHLAEGTLDDEASVDNYVRELLEEADSELAARLLTEESGGS